MIEYEAWDGEEWYEYYPEVKDKIFKIGDGCGVKGFFAHDRLDESIGLNPDSQYYVCLGSDNNWVEVLRKVETDRTGKYCECCGQREEEED